MASTTKILTAIVVIENSPDLSAIVTVSSKAAHTGGSRLGLSTDDKISVYDLLYGLLMVSGNDAAVALAEFISNDINGFSILMNQKANELGLTSSHFVTPTVWTKMNIIQQHMNLQKLQIMLLIIKLLLKLLELLITL